MNICAGLLGLSQTPSNNKLILGGSKTINSPTQIYSKVGPDVCHLERTFLLCKYIIIFDIMCGWWWRGYNIADQMRLLRSSVSIIDKQSGYFIMTPN